VLDVQKFKMSLYVEFGWEMTVWEQKEKMCCVSARRLSIHKTYYKFKNKFAE
jgi:hypothetical protein